MNNWVKNIGVWAVILIVLMMVFMQVSNRQAASSTMTYSTMMSEAKAGNVEKVKEESARSVKATLRDGKTYTVYLPGNVFTWDDLIKAGVNIEAKPPEENSFLMQIFISWFPMLLLIGV